MRDESWCRSAEMQLETLRRFDTGAPVACHSAAAAAGGAISGWNPVHGGAPWLPSSSLAGDSPGQSGTFETAVVA
jgi:hypothetical protein